MKVEVCIDIPDGTSCYGCKHILVSQDKFTCVIFGAELFITKPPGRFTIGYVVKCADCAYVTLLKLEETNRGIMDAYQTLLTREMERED